MKANKTLRAFSRKHNHRLITMSFETDTGSDVTFEGCVRRDDASRVAELFNELLELARLAEVTNSDTPMAKDNA